MTYRIGELIEINLFSAPIVIDCLFEYAAPVFCLFEPLAIDLPYLFLDAAIKERLFRSRDGIFMANGVSARSPVSRLVH